MASITHEMLVELIAEHPELLLPALRERLGDLPLEIRFRRGESVTGQVPPLRSDLTLELFHPGADEPFLAITVEVQLTADDGKPFSWLLYHAGQHYRLRVPCFLLVVTNNPAIAAWAAEPFRSGMVTLVPLVLGPADIPAITNPEDAQRSLHRTLLSGIVHGQEPIAVDIGLALAAALDLSPDDTGLFYWDSLLASLDEAIRKALEMQLHNWKPRSEWGKRFLANALAEATTEALAEGLAEGLAKGHAERLAKCILELLEARGLPPDPMLQQRITACTDLDQLGQWFHRATTATSTAEVFTP